MKNDWTVAETVNKWERKIKSSALQMSPYINYPKIRMFKMKVANKIHSNDNIQKFKLEFLNLF